MKLDRALLRPANDMTAGTVPVLYRRALDPSIFTTAWAYVDHLVVPPGAATSAHLHREVGEFYYVMAGEGMAKVANDSAAIRMGDAIPIQLGEAHAFENTGAQPLEFLIVGVSRDNTRRVDRVDVSGRPALR